MATSNRPWLERLKHYLATGQGSEKAPQTPSSPTDKTDNTPTRLSSVGFVGVSDQVHEGEIAWRVAILRLHVAHTGPIILPAVRAGIPPLVNPVSGVYGSHCGSCGEPRESGQRFHCRACQRARYLLLHEVREDVYMPKAEDRRGGAA